MVYADGGGKSSAGKPNAPAAAPTDAAAAVDGDSEGEDFDIDAIWVACVISSWQGRGIIVYLYLL